MLLAVDTSTAQVGLSLYDGAQVIGEYAWRSRQRHTGELAPAISELLSRCEVTMQDVRVLGVALGPGSFTSLRVGLSLVKGLALARGLPLVGIPTLDILAASQPLSRTPLLVALQAGRGRLAAGWYRRSKSGWRPRGPVQVLTMQALADGVTGPVTVCAELTPGQRQDLAANDLIRLTSPAQSIRRPAILAERAWARWQAGDVDDRAALAPIYVHSAEPIPA